MQAEPTSAAPVNNKDNRQPLPIHPILGIYPRGQSPILPRLHYSTCIEYTRNSQTHAHTHTQTEDVEKKAVSPESWIVGENAGQKENARVARSAALVRTKWPTVRMAIVSWNLEVVTERKERKERKKLDLCATLS